MEILLRHDNLKMTTGVQQLEEQIASNHLIIDQIMQYLKKEDLLRLSLVNKLWLQKARGNLNKKRKCRIILMEEPCRTLLSLNASLVGKTNMFYNGIEMQPRQMYNNRMKWYEHQWKTMSCQNCLARERIRNLDEVKVMYSILLDVIRFEYIKCVMPKNECPAIMLIEIILKEKGYLIKQFSARFFSRCSPWIPFLEQNVYPNLRAIKLGMVPDNIIQDFLPNLKVYCNKAFGFVYERDGSGIVGWNGPNAHLYTCALIQNKLHPLFYMENRPVWKRLNLIHLELSGENEVAIFFERFLWASTSISVTLRDFSCELQLLADLAAIQNLPRFWALKKIKTYLKINPCGKLYLMGAINWDLLAPNLYEVICSSGQSEVEGHVFNFKSLSTRELHYPTNDLYNAANTFPNVIKLRTLEGSVVERFQQMLMFSQLEDFNFLFEDLEVNLDFLLGIHKNELKSLENLSLDDVRNICIVPGPHSLLNFKDLKRIEVAWTFSKDFSVPQHVMSKGAGILIAAKMPGLCVDLELRASLRNTSIENYFAFQNRCHDGFKLTLDVISENLRLFAKVQPRQSSSLRSSACRIVFDAKNLPTAPPSGLR